MGDGTTVDFDVTFSDGSSERVTAREVPHTGLPLWEVGRWAGGSPERAVTTWAWETCRVRCARSLGIDAIRRVAPTSAVPSDTAESRLAALEMFVAELAHGTGWVRASDLGSYSDVMRRATAQREARLGLAGYGRNPATDFFVFEHASDADWSRAAESADRVVEMRRATAHVRREVADAAAYLLDGVRVRTVHVGVASGGAWSIEDAEDAIHAATWGRPLTGYVVGLGREMVVVLKQVPRCP